MRIMLGGSIVAIVTPFRNGVIDRDALADLVEWHIESNTRGIVPVGTTGESPTLSHEEHEEVVELVVETAKKRIPVIAGTGSNSTAEAVRLTQHAANVGAAAALVVTPYYNRPTQEGLIEHFTQVHDCAEIPVIIYNIPGRSAVDMTVETMAKLSKLPRIVGVKDATGDLARVSKQRAACGEDFLQLSGEDATALALNAHGGSGCISVTANVAPRECALFQTACEEGNYARALEWQDRLMPLHEALFIESSPAPVKYALSVLGRCAPDLRAPLVEVRPDTREKVKQAMRHAGLIN